MATRAKTKAKRKVAKKTARRGLGQRTAAATQVYAWMDDPMGAGDPIAAAAPALPGAQLATVISGQQPTAQLYPKQSSGFRYWAAAEVLRRAAAFWIAALPAGQTWQPGKQLPVKLDVGVDLNAYYDRASLSFFHDSVGGTTYYSGESPDVVAHELGHGILDAIKPELWDTMSIEVAAFHESFGDMSAMMTALQLPSLRQVVLQQTGGRLTRNSSLSRLAEQLGFAIRQVQPDAVDADSLRNAANNWIYRDPTQLPQSGPSNQLTQEPHNFSRLFTGAFLDMLSGMLLALNAQPTDADLAQVSQDAAKLLVKAVIAAPVVNRFYEAVAKNLAAEALSQFQGRYAQAVRGAFVRRNILPATMAPAASIRAFAARASVPLEPTVRSLPGSALGLPAETVHFMAPADAASTAHLGIAGAPGDSARAFVERIVQRLHIDVGASAQMAMASHPTQARQSHRLVRRKDGAYIERQFFDCGF